MIERTTYIIQPYIRKITNHIYFKRPNEPKNTDGIDIKHIYSQNTWTLGCFKRERVESKKEEGERRAEWGGEGEKRSDKDRERERERERDREGDRVEN